MVILSVVFEATSAQDNKINKFQYNRARIKYKIDRTVRGIT